MSTKLRGRGDSKRKRATQCAACAFAARHANGGLTPAQSGGTYVRFGHSVAAMTARTDGTFVPNDESGLDDRLTRERWGFPGSLRDKEGREPTARRKRGVQRTGRNAASLRRGAALQRRLIPTSIQHLTRRGSIRTARRQAELQAGRARQRVAARRHVKRKPDGAGIVRLLERREEAIAKGGWREGRGALHAELSEGVRQAAGASRSARRWRSRRRSY